MKQSILARRRGDKEEIKAIVEFGNGRTSELSTACDNVIVCRIIYEDITVCEVDSRHVKYRFRKRTRYRVKEKYREAVQRSSRHYSGPVAGR